MLRNWKNGVHKTMLFVAIFAFCLVLFAPSSVTSPVCAAEANQLQLNQNVITFGEDFSLRYYDNTSIGKIVIYERDDTLYQYPLYERELDNGINHGYLLFDAETYPLVPGEYEVVYYRRSSVIGGRQRLVVTTDAFYASQTEFSAGTDGFLYYDPNILGEDAWIGVYEADADPLEDYSIVWSYLSDEEEQIWTGSLTGNSNRFIYLEPGAYCICLYLSGESTAPDETFEINIHDPDFPHAAYKRSSDAKDGTVEGSIVIDCGEKKLEDYYWFYWGNEEGILDGYTPFAVLDTENGSSVSFRSNEEAPAGATHMYIYPGTSRTMRSTAVPLVLEMPDNISADYSPVLTSFVVLSDVHVTQSATNVFNRNFTNALKQVVSSMPDSSAVILSGDITNNGKTPEYEKLMNAISSYADSLPEVYFTVGNHDMMFNRDDPERQIEYFLEYTQMPGNYYQFEVDGYGFFVLGSDGQPDSVSIGSDVSWMSQEQLDWLAEGLAAEAARAPDQPIFVISHQPLENTVPESHYATIQQNDQLMEILEQYPQVVFISGHTHYALDVEGVVNSGDGETINTVHAGCVSRLWSREVGNYDGSQGIYVEVCADYVRINGYDFEEKNWMGGGRYILYNE